MNSTAFSFLANSSPEVNENKKMELTIGSLSFYVGSSGSTRLSDPAKSGPSARRNKTITMSGSSVGSSSEVNSSVSFAATDNTQKKTKKLNGTREEPDIEGSVDKSCDSQRDFATGSSGVSRSIHQLYVIITEAAEENDHADQQTKEQWQEGEGKNSRLHQRVENHHVSRQPQHGSTRQFKEGSSDGVSVRTTSTQKETEGRKRRAKEKSRKQ
jgi:hypothetical protein